MNLDDAATALAGVWLLVEYRDRVSVDDPWFEPYGSEPTGMFVYDPAGHLSVHVAPSVDAPADAKYLGYFGRLRSKDAFTIDQVFTKQKTAYRNIDKVTATYDAKVRPPDHGQRRPRRNAIDDEYGFGISDFVPR